MTQPASRTTGPAARKKRGGSPLPWIFAALGGLASLVVWQLLLLQQAKAIEAQFQLDAGERELVIQERFEDALRALHSVWALYAAVDEPNGDQFSTFVRPVLDRHPYIQAVGWNPLITDSERDAFEREARAAGATNFRITERAAQGQMVPAGSRDYYVVVRHIEPYEGNEAALGFDTASEPKRFEAMSRARETGELAITSRITLVQEQQQQFGVLGFTPVRRPTAGRSPLAAADGLAGFVVGVLRIGAMVESGMASLSPVAFDLVITDESAPPGERRLFATTPEGAEIQPALLSTGTPLQRSRSIKLGGKDWTISFAASEVYRDGLRTGAPLVGLLASLLLTVLATAFLMSVSGRAARAQERRAELEESTLALRQAAERSDAAEAALLESEERLRLTLETVADGAWDWNLATGKTIYSDSLIEALGYDRREVEPHVSFWQGLIHPDDRPATRTALERHLDGQTPAYEIENRLRLKSGEYGWHLSRGRVVARDADGAALRMVGTAANIDEIKKARQRQLREEQQVRQAQKLESLGVLAGGIAHDFNNLLVAILGGTDLALHEVPEGSPAREHLELVKTAAGRAADLIRQIHAYSGDTSFTLERIDLSALVKGVGQLLHASVSKKVRLRSDFGQGLPEVEGDATQLRQVVMNLIVNASDALEDRPGEIRVSTSLVAVESEGSQRDYVGQALQPGSYVCLEVSDDGKGMRDEVVAKIFDPFFTTKKRGQGLGLAATLGIVRSHGGGIRVRSRVDEGTTIRVLLPSAGPVDIPAEQRVEAARERWQASGTALVVDDDPAVRTIAQRMLSALGMDVVTAVDGQDGVEKFTGLQDEIAVTLLDMSMPRMDGADAFREIRRIRPDARILLSSGYSERNSAALLAGDNRASFVQKPYRMNELREKLERILVA